MKNDILYQNDKGIYYVRFYANGRDQKKSTRTNIRREAEIFAKEYFNKIKASANLVESAIKTEYEHILYNNNNITLNDAFKIFTKQPRKKSLTDRSGKQKLGYWKDFECFLNSKYPEIKKIIQVDQNHAKEYIQHIREKGKFDKTRNYIFEGKNYQGGKPLQDILTPNTCNKFHTALKEIFTKLLEDKKSNPFDFDKLQLKKSNPNKRQAFSQEDINKVFATGNDFVKDIFTIGLNTGLRTGDICTLTKNDIDLKHKIVKRILNKTGEEVIIYILPEFETFLKEKIKSSPDDYILPEHAQLYSNQNKRSEISARVKTLLNTLNIENLVKIKGQKGASIKDIHSLRHTFIYEASKNGVPLHVIQSIVGHSAIEMTLYYSEHTQLTEIKEAMQKMNLSAPTQSKEDIKELVDSLQGLSPEKLEAIQQIINSKEFKK